MKAIYLSLRGLFHASMNNGFGWMLPFIYTLVFLSLILGFLNVISPLAPFVYSLF